MNIFVLYIRMNSLTDATRVFFNKIDILNFIMIYIKRELNYNYFHKALTRFLRTIGPETKIPTTKPLMVNNN